MICVLYYIGQYILYFYCKYAISYYQKKMLMLREKAKKRVANTSLAIVTDQKYFKDIKYLTHQTLH